MRTLVAAIALLCAPAAGAARSWITKERYRSAPPGATSRTRRRTRSHARSLASRAQLNIARSRIRRATFNCCRMAQMCFGLNGALGPIRRPAFQGRVGRMNKSDWRMANLRCGHSPALPILLPPLPLSARRRLQVPTDEQTFASAIQSGDFRSTERGTEGAIESASSRLDIHLTAG